MRLERISYGTILCVSSIHYMVEAMPWLVFFFLFVYQPPRLPIPLLQRYYCHPACTNVLIATKDLPIPPQFSAMIFRRDAISAIPLPIYLLL